MIDELRPVSVMKKAWDIDARDARKWRYITDRTGRFHQFAQMSEEGSGGVSEPVAIVELDDGTVITPEAELIKFDDR